MRPKSSSAKKPAEQVVKDIRRATRRHFSAEDKIRIVLEGLRGDDKEDHGRIWSYRQIPHFDRCTVNVTVPYARIYFPVVKQIVPRINEQYRKWVGSRSTPILNPPKW